MNRYFLIMIFPLFLYCQTTKVSITKAEINDLGDGKKLFLEYHADSLKTNAVSQVRITSAKAVFSDNRHSDLDFSEYYDISNPKPWSVISFKPLKKQPLKIKTLTGKLDYYNPTIENGDIKILDNPRAKMNTKVLNELSGFEFYMVDVNALINLRNLSKSERYIQAQKIIGIPRITSEFKKSLDYFFKYLDQSVFNQTGAFFYIYDPSDSFFTIRIMDKDGKLRNPGYSSSSKYAWKYIQIWGDSMDQKLAFLFYTKNSVKEYNFNITDIEIKIPKPDSL